MLVGFIRRASKNPRSAFSFGAEVMEKLKENYWKFSQIAREHTRCPNCTRLMEAKFSSILMPHYQTHGPYPQQRWYWECDCGYQELGGIHSHDQNKDNVPI